MVLLQVVVLLTFIPIYHCETINAGQSGTYTCVEDGACVIECKGSDDCGGDDASSVLTCKDGYPCDIQCTGEDSCGSESGSTTINCGAATSCSITCGSRACGKGDGNIFINCDTANTCSLTCNGQDACGRDGGDADLNCGSSACSLQCITSCTSRLDVVATPTTQSYQCSGNCGASDPQEFTATPSKAPTSGPTSDPSPSPSETPSQSPVTSAPTSSPSNDPTIEPSESPTKSPSDEPTQAPSKEPSATPSSMPSENPSSFPSETPTSDPSKEPSTSPSLNPSQSPTQPTLTPSRSPLPNGQTYSPTKDPSVNPTTPQPTIFEAIAYTPTTAADGSVGDTPTVVHVGDDKPATVAKEDGLLEDYMYVVIGCGSMVCCLVMIVILFKCRKKRKQSLNDEDEFRSNANKSTQAKGSMDVWTNPVHHQVSSISAHSPVRYEGNLNTTANVLRVASLSASSYDDEPSSQRENYGQLYTVPQKKKQNIDTNQDDVFGENLGNNVAADDAVMDDIVHHMATPMGDEIDDLLEDDDDYTPTIEMEDIQTGYHQNNGEDQEDGVDDINNFQIGHAHEHDENDDDIAGDINNVFTPKGPNNNADEGDNSDISIGDAHKVTIGNDNLAADEFVVGDNYVDDIDNAMNQNDNDNNLVNEVDNFLITHGHGNINDDDHEEDEDVLDDINNEVNLYTPGGDVDDEDLALDDFVETMQ